MCRVCELDTSLLQYRPEVVQPKCSADGNVIEWLPSSPTRLHLACMSTSIWICRANSLG